jgi:type 1 fimbriae regulatory protein FimB/type 1 fimbriae regulatory protein FimE
MKSFTREQLDRLLEVAKDESFIDYLMLLCTFNHGLRVSETLSLTASNIVGGYIIVERGKKSHRCEHPLLPSEAEYLTKLQGKFFNMCRMTFWRRMQHYGAKAGLPPHLCHPHVLKHSCGRIAYEGGMGIPEIQRWLGHKNGANTMVYLQATDEQAAKAFVAAVGK